MSASFVAAKPDFQLIRKWEAKLRAHFLSLGLKPVAGARAILQPHQWASNGVIAARFEGLSFRFVRGSLLIAATPAARPKKDYKTGFGTGAKRKTAGAMPSEIAALGPDQKEIKRERKRAIEEQRAAEMDRNFRYDYAAWLTEYMVSKQQYVGFIYNPFAEIRDGNAFEVMKWAALAHEEGAVPPVYVEMNQEVFRKAATASVDLFRAAVLLSYESREAAPLTEYIQESARFVAESGELALAKIFITEQLDFLVNLNTTDRDLYLCLFLPLEEMNITENVIGYRKPGATPLETVNTFMSQQD